MRRVAYVGMALMISFTMRLGVGKAADDAQAAIDQFENIINNAVDMSTAGYVVKLPSGEYGTLLQHKLRINVWKNLSKYYENDKNDMNETLKTSVETARLVWNSSKGKWTKVFAKYSDISYDVKKTDSVISPYEGIVTGLVGGNEGNKESDNPKEVEADINSTTIQPEYKFELRYAYQKGKWVLKSSRIMADKEWHNLWDDINDPSMGMIYSLWSQGQ